MGLFLNRVNHRLRKLNELADKIRNGEKVEL